MGPPPNQTDIAWAAGVFDGEGCVSIEKRRHRQHYAHVLGVVIGQSGYALPPMLEKLQKMYGGAIIGPRVYKSYKPSWRWQVGSSSAEAFLRSILLYSVEKKQQIEIALLYREEGMVPKHTKKNVKNWARAEELRILLQDMKRS